MKYGDNLSGLSKLAKGSANTVNSKGIILSVHDFNGIIEFFNNTVVNNHVMISSAMLSNNQKTTNFKPVFSDFEQANT